MLDAGRSQPIMRLPVDRVSAQLTLHDGERFEGILFLPGGEQVPELLSEGEPFIPVGHGNTVRLVARSALACIAIPSRPDLADADLPIERQQATIRLRSGAVVTGELRWTAPPGWRRTGDHLKDSARHVTVHGGGITTFVAKAHIAWVEEI